jgi:uroporphyrin-3 C-methyltransferase
MQAQQSQTASELSALGSQLRQSEQAREQLASALREEQQQLEQLMVETAQRLSRRQDLEADRWPLEEALALLRLAERRLQLDGNGDVALRLVNAADQVLSGLTQAAVLPVRRQLARDRLALQAVETPDINGLYFRLAAMADRIRSLTWTPEASVIPEPVAEESLSWQAFMDSLSSIVTITRLDVSHQAAPLLGDFALWQQQSLLLTEQAQLALLAGNQALYEAALAQLNDRLESMQASLPVSELLDEVATLTQARLVPDLPDIHGSIEALEGYMVNLQPDEATNGGEGS